MIYNNVFFCNESTKMNYKHNDFNIFRCMNEIKYLIDVLFANSNDVYKFCQIYQINFFFKTIEKRMKNDIENNSLNKKKFLRLQRLMKNINFYAKFFKNCDKRMKKISIHVTKFV